MIFKSKITKILRFTLEIQTRRKWTSLLDSRLDESLKIASQIDTTLVPLLFSIG
jgi:hypothetical protein